MKLFQFKVSTNDEIVNLKQSYHGKECILKSIHVISKAGYATTNYVMNAEIEFLDQSVNVHSSDDSDHIIIPLDKETGKRFTVVNYDVMFKNIDIPKSFYIRLFDEAGAAFDNTKIGAVVFTFEVDSTK